MTVGYIALTWTAEAAPAAERLSGLVDSAPSWRRIYRVEGLEIWTAGCRLLPITHRPDLGAVIVGRVFGSSGGAPRAPGEAPGRVGARLLETHWGDYVALIRAPDTGRTWALRDPSGALDALTWSRDGVGVVASDVDQIPSGLLPRTLGLDWAILADAVRRPLSVTARSPLEGLHTISPGDLQPVGGSPSQATPLWRPAAFVASPRPASPDTEADLQRRVECAVVGLAGAYPRLLVEVSGGLDSAIVATTLLRLGLASHVAATLHLVDDHLEGEERAWAAPVLSQFSGHPVFQALRVDGFDAASLASVSKGARPAFNALDFNRLNGTRAAVEAAGADAILTGKGGDAVFFQHPTPAVLADFLLAHGQARLLGGTAQMVARWLRRSVWSVARDARRILREGMPGETAIPLWGARTWAAPRGAAHPWLADLDGSPPAKQWQVKGLLLTHLQRGANTLSAVADVLHPLMSQPVVEGLLPIASWDLVRGGRERGLARAVFADRVPAEILARRSKGQLNAHFAKTVAASLTFLRPYLLEGCLVEAEILDRRALDAALRPDALIWDADPTAILNAAALEAWVRHWQGRAPDCAAAPRRRR